MSNFQNLVSRRSVLAGAAAIVAAAPLAACGGSDEPAGSAAGSAAEAAVAAAGAVLEARGITADYLVVRGTDLGEPVPGEEGRMLVAARVGEPRLLDNVAVQLGV